MATVRIGDRDLEVKVATLGFLKKLMPAQRAVREAKEDDVAMVDALAGLIFAYVGHNEGVTLEWLLDNVPPNPNPLLVECLLASGQKVAPPGEAPSP